MGSTNPLTYHVLYLVLCVNILSATADSRCIETMIKSSLENFEQKILETLQTHFQHNNSHLEQEYGFEKQFQKLQFITYTQHKEVIEKVATQGLDVQKIARIINDLEIIENLILDSFTYFQQQSMNKTNDLIVNQAELQKQLVSQNQDLLASHSDLQNQFISQKNVYHALQTELLKQLKSMNDSLKVCQSDHQKQFLCKTTDLQSDLHRQLLRGNNFLLASQSDLQKELTSLTKVLKESQSDVQKQLMSLKDELDQIKINVLPSSCATLNVKATNTYYIRPYGFVEKPFLVLCDFDDKHKLGGGWTVFLRRFNGMENFGQNWTMYKNGFGDVNGEHWMGLERLHAMTRSGEHELLVLLEDFEGNSTYALYGEFEIGSEAEKYKLTVGKYSGTAGDSLAEINGMNFSSVDKDNGPCTWENRKRLLSSSWWFNKCFPSLSAVLTGAYCEYSKHLKTGIVWPTFRGSYYSLKSATMMVRKRACT